MDQEQVQANIAAPVQPDANIANPNPQRQDVFQGISQEPQGEQSAATPVSQGTGSDESRYQYWQSEYDKMRVKYGDAEDKYNRINQYQPIVEYLSANPNIVEMIDNQLNQGTRKPEAPQRPNTYDAVDAVTNPSSESFKYRQMLDEYRDNMGQYLETKYAAIEERETQDRAAYEQRQQENNQRREIHSYLTQKHGMQEPEVIDFVNMMSSEESTSPENLVKYYKFLKGQNALPQQEQPRRGFGSTLPPLGVMGGQGSPTTSDDEMFSQSFLPANKRKQSF